jgi:hypothetical protein
VTAPPRRHSDRETPDEDPNHKAGKRTGYSEADGYLTLARAHTETMDHLLDRLAAERRTSGAMLCVIQTAAVEREAEVQRAIRQWWQNVADDLDLDLKEGWEYLPSIQSIRRRAQGPRTEPSPVEEPKPMSKKPARGKK